MSETREFDFHAEAGLRKNLIELVRGACIKANIECHILVVAGITDDAVVDSLAHMSPMINMNATILNISEAATRNFVIEDGWISFMTMFKGVPHDLRINIGSVFQVYSPTQSGLTIVMPDTFTAGDEEVDTTLPPERRKPTLRIVK